MDLGFFFYLRACWNLKKFRDIGMFGATGKMLEIVYHILYPLFIIHF